MKCVYGAVIEDFQLKKSKCELLSWSNNVRIGVGREKWYGLPVLWVVITKMRQINVMWGNGTIRGQGTVFGWLANIGIVHVTSNDVYFRRMIQ